MTVAASTYLWVALGGALGSVARFGASRIAARLADGPFPWGTLFVNLTGSLLIGVLAGLVSLGGRFADAPDVRAFLMVGVLGGFTTFSSFSLETLRLVNDGEWLAAGANVLGSVCLCLGSVWVGYAIGATVGR